MAEKWSLKGAMTGTCSCDFGCPCNFDARPSKGWCEGGYTWTIKEGHYGGVKLDGLHLAWLAKFPGPLHEGNGTGVWIIDERADAQQRAALEALTKAGEVGLPFDVFAAIQSKVHDPIYAPFEVQLDGIRSQVRIGRGKVMELAMTRIKNPVTGAEEEIYLDKPTGFTSLRAEMGTSTRFQVRTGPLAFDHPGQYAEYGEFAYAGG